MDKAEILILPEADEFLSLLPEILVKNSYYIWRESAERLVNEILEFILTIPNLPHYTLTEKAANYFRRYGSDLLYVFLSENPVLVRLGTYSFQNVIIVILSDI